MSEFDRTRTGGTESDPTNTDYFSPNVFELGTNLRATEPGVKSGLARAYEWTYGAVAVGLIGGALLFEQSPANERWRIQEGLETLVETGDPNAVERTVQLVTLPIEIVPAILIGLAVHSSNPVIKGARNAFQNWQESGEKRIKYRAHVKLGEQAVKDNWKRLVEEDKELAREHEMSIERPNHYWESLVVQEKNKRRAIELKKPKFTSLEKDRAKQQEKEARLHWKELVKGDRLARKQAKLEAREVKQREKNEDRISGGKRPKAYKDKTLLHRSVGIVANEVTDALLALGLGAGIVIFKEAVTDTNVSLKRTILTGAKAVAIISYVSGKIGYFIAAGTNAAQWEVPGTEHVVHYEQQAQWLIDYGTDTKFLVGALLAAKAPGTLKKLYHRMPKREVKFQKWLAGQEEGKQGKGSPNPYNQTF